MMMLVVMISVNDHDYCLLVIRFHFKTSIYIFMLYGKLNLEHSK